MVRIERLVIVGVGLIGGSFARALAARGRVGHIVGVGRSTANLQTARDLGVIHATEPVRQAVTGADFVLLATPVGQMEAILAEIAPVIGPDCVVSDGGSTKADVVVAARRAMGAKFRQFVPAHPIAGGEQSGAAASNPTLFEGRRVILTPEPETDPAFLARVRMAWEACGAQVSLLDARAHDATLGIVSHLPHLLAYALMDQVLQSPQARTLLDHAGSGFRDFTRLASSHPEMWRDVFIANRDALLEGLRGFEASLAALRRDIEVGDAARLDAVLTQCRDGRNAWLAASGFDARA